MYDWLLQLWTFRLVPALFELVLTMISICYRTNSSKFVNISTFLIPHTISSVCFGCFDTGPKHRNKLENFFWVFVKKQTEKQSKQIEFRFVLVWTEKKKKILRTPNRERFLEIFSVCFEKILLVSVVSIPVRNTETNWKKCFLVLWNKPKNNRNRLSFGLFRFEQKKNLIVSRTPYSGGFSRIVSISSPGTKDNKIQNLLQ